MDSEGREAAATTLFLPTMALYAVEDMAFVFPPEVLEALFCIGFGQDLDRKSVV